MRAWAAAVLLLGVVGGAPAVAADLTTGQVAEALRRHVCFSRVWWGDPYARLGQTVTVDVRLAGAMAYAWSEDMRAVPRTPKWADSYVLVGRSAGPVVTQRSGYNIDLLRGEPAYERDRRRVYGGRTERLRLELPAACGPRFDPETPLKAEMRAMIVASLTNAVKTWGRRPAGGQVRVTVADFNVDYPEAFALRQDTGEVLRLTLMSNDPFSYLGGAGRQYLVTPAPRGPVAIQLRRLILKHGRTQTIRIR
ncbi:MAG: hypothetical protein JNK30_16900 [Phenylobacterium sp.]|uniref:hypothetical protein n=1 Tax=Phenylobacterium sp. TaxID=1871053 RepID=UPI001A61E37C|nr:hypothetical protein [Phenylobacterium sp.]MBL8773063.1 hypothetical protein [Phenylobacterium sp.]